MSAISARSRFVRVRRVVAMRMSVIMSVIGAVHRLEMFGYLLHGRAKPFEHEANDRIAADENAFRVNLRGEMPVADVPGQMPERHASRPDLIEIFCRCNDPDGAAVFESERVAVGQQNRLRQIHHELEALLGGDQLAAQVPIVGIELERAEWLRLEVMTVGDCS